MSTIVAVASVIPESASSAEDLLLEAEVALNSWVEALFSGDPATVAAVLAPQFQLIRSNGEGFSREQYLKNLPRQNKRISFSDIVVTGDTSILIVRYRADVDQEINGQVTTGTAPRLSVFTRTEERWLLAAHANFSAIS
jgi:ketosteroid isomerase-like protein